MTKLKRFAAALFLLAATGAASADAAYPNKPIRLVVPFPPGGGTDIVSRVLAVKLSRMNGWNIVVENRPGAGGDIGVDVAAKAAPDGYTMVMGQTSNLAVNVTLNPHLPYNPVKDLAPIASVASAPLVLVVSSASPFKTMAEVVAAAKARPGTITFASPGNGTVAHLTGEMLQRAAGIKLQHIPYKGSSQAITDLLGGQVQLFMSSIPTAMGQIKSGKMRALAVSSSHRAHDLPAIPTLSESGFAGFESATWFGLLAPAGTPASIVATLNTEINRALKAPEVREKIAAEGAEPLGGTPEQFGALIKSEIAKWAPVVKDSGAKVD